MPSPWSLNLGWFTSFCVFLELTFFPLIAWGENSFETLCLVSDAVLLLSAGNAIRHLEEYCKAAVFAQRKSFGLPKNLPLVAANLLFLTIFNCNLWPSASGTKNARCRLVPTVAYLCIIIVDAYIGFFIRKNSSSKGDYVAKICWIWTNLKQEALIALKICRTRTLDVKMLCLLCSIIPILIQCLKLLLWSGLKEATPS